MTTSKTIFRVNRLRQCADRPEEQRASLRVFRERVPREKERNPANSEWVRHLRIEGSGEDRSCSDVSNDVAWKAYRERGGHQGDANPEERMDQVYVGRDWEADAEENETTSRDDRYNQAPDF